MSGGWDGTGCMAALAHHQANVPATIKGRDDPSESANQQSRDTKRENSSNKCNTAVRVLVAADGMLRRASGKQQQQNKAEGETINPCFSHLGPKLACGQTVVGLRFALRFLKNGDSAAAKDSMIRARLPQLAAAQLIVSPVVVCTTCSL